MTDQNQNQSQTQGAQTSTPPVSNEMSNDKTMAIIAYILFFVPLLAVKNRSAFLNYHVNQGLALFIVALAGSVVLGSVLGRGMYSFSGIWNLAMIVLMVIGIVNASRNETKPLPVIGNWFHIIK